MLWDWIVFLPQDESKCAAMAAQKLDGRCGGCGLGCANVPVTTRQQTQEAPGFASSFNQ